MFRQKKKADLRGRPPLADNDGNLASSSCVLWNAACFERARPAAKNPSSGASLSTALQNMLVLGPGPSASTAYTVFALRTSDASDLGGTICARTCP